MVWHMQLITPVYCQATQKGYKKSSGRQASITGGDGKFSTTEFDMGTYSTKRVNWPLPVGATGFSTAFVIWYCGDACVPTDAQQNSSCRFWLLEIIAGFSTVTKSVREVEALPMEPTISNACFRLLQAKIELVPKQVQMEFTPNLKEMRLEWSASLEAALLQDPSVLMKARLTGLNILQYLVLLVPLGTDLTSERRLPLAQPMLELQGKLPTCEMNWQPYRKQTQVGPLMTVLPITTQEDEQSTVTLAPLLMKNSWICLTIMQVEPTQEEERLVGVSAATEAEVIEQILRELRVIPLLPVSCEMERQGSLPNWEDEARYTLHSPSKMLFISFSTY